MFAAGVIRDDGTGTQAGLIQGAAALGQCANCGSALVLWQDGGVRLSLAREEWFADLYSDRGRPSVSPVLLSRIMLLVFHDNRFDRRAEEHARYDLRWKTALGLGIDEAEFDATAL
jgi:hypothetical protein